MEGKNAGAAAERREGLLPRKGERESGRVKGRKGTPAVLKSAPGSLPPSPSLAGGLSVERRIESQPPAEYLRQGAEVFRGARGKGRGYRGRLFVSQLAGNKDAVGRPVGRQAGKFMLPRSRGGESGMFVDRPVEENVKICIKTARVTLSSR